MWLKRKWVTIGISIAAVVLVVLCSLSTVIGYQTVQSSHQQTIKEAVNQRELLFQTIIDLVNNKEIQRIILKSQMMNGKFRVSDIPVLTKNQLKQIYFIGLLLSKGISTSMMQSIVGTYQFSNQKMQKEIDTVIEKDAVLREEITQLKNTECECEDKKIFLWPFPVICSILFLCIISLNVILSFVYRLTGVYYVDIYNKLVGVIGVLATILFCYWI